MHVIAAGPVHSSRDKGAFKLKTDYFVCIICKHYMYGLEYSACLTDKRHNFFSHPENNKFISGGKDGLLEGF